MGDDDGVPDGGSWRTRRYFWRRRWLVSGQALALRSGPAALLVTRGARSGGWCMCGVGGGVGGAVGAGRITDARSLSVCTRWPHEAEREGER